MAATSAGKLPAAAADRLARDCERPEITGRAERAVVAASAQADLLMVARDGDRTRLDPKSLGKTTRLVVDHAARPVLLVWPGSAPDVGTISSATSPFPTGSLNPRNPDTVVRLLADQMSAVSGPGGTCVTATFALR